MKTISTRTRLTSMVLAAATTAVVLGSTVAGMQYSAETQPAIVVMESIHYRNSGDPSTGI